MSEFKCFSNSLFMEDGPSIRSIDTQIAELDKLCKSGGDQYDIHDHMSNITNSLNELEVAEWTRNKLQAKFQKAIGK